MIQGVLKSVGALTIGQAPRDDIVPDLEAAMGPQCRIVQAGALDGVEDSELDRQAPRLGRGFVVTRLRSGIEVRVRESFARRRIQVCVDNLQQEVDLIMLLCTGDLPNVKARCPILYPARILRAAALDIDARSLGVLAPAAAQVRAVRRRWRGVAGRVAVAHASPYGPTEVLLRAAEELRTSEPDVIVMDCIGYTRPMQMRVQNHVGRPSLAPLSLLSPVAREVLGIAALPPTGAEAR